MKGLALATTFLLTTAALMADTPQERLQDTAQVFHQIMQTPDKGVPQDLLDKAECVIIVPNLVKGAFIVGGEFGRGYAECRQKDGTGWTAPAAVRIEGGSVGFQIGGSSTDLVLLVMNREGMRKILSDKVTLGADASVAAGPVGRSATAQTDVEMTAEILSYSRSKGVFAGIALKGATLRPDSDVDHILYGPNVSNREILMGSVHPPAAAHQLITELDHYSMRGQGNADRTVHH
jgi:lipid-binding SYLF domain-containing protein